jgi:NADH-quinone oxidoreductase subunit G
VLYLLNADPTQSELPQRPWERAMDSARGVIAHSELLTDALREHADVVFPAESYAEKDGTVVHPDGRLQRVRPAIGRQGQTRPGWWVIAELARRLGFDVAEMPAGPAGSGDDSVDAPGLSAIMGGLSTAAASLRLFAAVGIYAGLTPDEIGGRGVRWTERDAVSAFPAPPQAPLQEPLPSLPSPNGALRLGRFRSIWVAPEVQLSPALRFARPRQQAEMAPADAGRLGLANGQPVLVGPADGAVRATVALRDTCPQGTVFLQEALASESASMLEDALVEIRPDEAPAAATSNGGPPASAGHQQGSGQ